MWLLIKIESLKDAGNKEVERYLLDSNSVKIMHTGKFPSELRIEATGCKVHPMTPTGQPDKINHIHGNRTTNYTGYYERGFYFGFPQRIKSYFDKTRSLVEQIEDFQRELRTQLIGYYFPEVPEIKCADISRKIPEIYCIGSLQKRSDIIMIDEAITTFEKEGAGMSYTVRKLALSLVGKKS